MTCLLRAASRCAVTESGYSANKQYRRGDSTRSIVALLRVFGALGGGLGHYFFDFGGIAGQALAQELVAGFGDDYVVFDTHAKVFLGDVNGGLHGDDHAGLKRTAVFTGVVDVEAEVVAETVNVILAEGFSVEIFSVGVDVVARDFVDAFVAFAAKIHARLEGGEGGVLGAEDDVVNLKLTGREFAVGGERAGDVRGIAGVLGADVQNDDVAVCNLAGKPIVVERGGIGSCTDDGSVSLGLGAAHLVDLHHFCRDLVFVEAGTHHAHGFEVGIETQIDGTLKKGKFTRRFDLTHC